MNDRTDLERLGLAIGHASDQAGATGLTVVRGIEEPLRAGVAVFGRATGSRDLLAASADHRVGGRVDAVMLTGGSAYGLDAAAGVMRWMEEHGRGFSVGAGIVPIVPAAVIFDLSPLGRFDARPTAQMAYDASASAVTSAPVEGSIGVGTGATVGKILGAPMAMKGGFGFAMEETANCELAVGAMVVVNALGDVRDDRGEIIAGARGSGGGFADSSHLLRRGELAARAPVEELAAQNTTLAIVAVSSPYAAGELTQLARAAGAALFRRITPVGSSFDGDVVFALSPERGARAGVDLMVAEALAVAALEQAIERAVRFAHGRDGIPGLADTGS